LSSLAAQYGHSRLHLLPVPLSKGVGPEGRDQRQHFLEELDAVVDRLQRLPGWYWLRSPVHKRSREGYSTV
jgi:hypothetical protein